MPFSNEQEMGKPVTIKDEGVTLASNVSSIDFVGDGVTGGAIGGVVTETIPGGGGSYTLPTATDSILGGVKVGSGLSITEGVLAVTGGSMVYPGAGIPLSTGEAWGTSITNNSANWNTAYDWGNHASAGYVTGTPWTAEGYLTSLTGAVLTDQSTPQTIGLTGSRLAMLWATDITCTNAISGSVTGNAGTATAAASQVITDNAIVTVDAADVADNDYAKFTANGVEGRSYSEVKTDLSLNNVENTALSTWAGSSSIITLGTVTTGTWNGTAIGVTKGGTGLTTIAAGSVLAANSADTLSAITSASGTYYLKNVDGTISWAAVAGGGTGITWNEVTDTTASASVDNGYICNNVALVTVTLPTTAAVGSVVRISGKGAVGWKLAQNASEIIHFGNKDTTTGTDGYLASSHIRDGVELVCVVADTEWNVISSVGNITIV
jgi:hypothetical protein